MWWPPRKTSSPFRRAHAASLLRKIRRPTTPRAQQMESQFSIARIAPMNQVHLILGDDEFLTERARLSIQKAAGELSLIHI